jgi:hypothetical protein
LDAEVPQSTEQSVQLSLVGERARERALAVAPLDDDVLEGAGEDTLAEASAHDDAVTARVAAAVLVHAPKGR